MDEGRTHENWMQIWITFLKVQNRAAALTEDVLSEYPVSDHFFSLTHLYKGQKAKSLNETILIWNQFNNAQNKTRWFTSLFVDWALLFNNSGGFSSTPSQTKHTNSSGSCYHQSAWILLDCDRQII